jgi:hypothetical protein
MLDSREPDLEFAKEILARLERYAARVRAGSVEAPAAPATAPLPEHLPAELPWLHIPQSDSRQLDDQLPRLAPPAAHRRAPARRRIDPATVDLFPYDLAASIIACALTVFAFAALGTVAGLVVTVGLVVAGVGARQLRYFPSAGVKALIGTAVGLLLVLIS